MFDSGDYGNYAKHMNEKRRQDVSKMTMSERSGLSGDLTYLDKILSTASKTMKAKKPNVLRMFNKNSPSNYAD